MTKVGLFNVYKKFYPDSKEEDVDTLVNHLFRVYDRDQNGSVDFKECILAVGMKSSFGTVNDKLNFSFSVYDINADGFIDKTEMAQVIGVSA